MDEHDPGSGATGKRPPTDRSATPPPDEFANPAGLGGDECDTEQATGPDASCDPSAAEDLVLEESKPGFGIFGYEGEEVGGG